MAHLYSQRQEPSADETQTIVNSSALQVPSLPSAADENELVTEQKKQANASSMSIQESLEEVNDVGRDVSRVFRTTGQIRENIGDLSSDRTRRDRDFERDQRKEERLQEAEERLERRDAEKFLTKMEKIIKDVERNPPESPEAVRLTSSDLKLDYRYLSAENQELLADDYKEVQNYLSEIYQDLELGSGYNRDSGHSRDSEYRRDSDSRHDTDDSSYERRTESRNSRSRTNKDSLEDAYEQGYDEGYEHGYEDGFYDAEDQLEDRHSSNRREDRRDRSDESGISITWEDSSPFMGKLRL
jgi:hypothetical protein